MTSAVGSLLGIPTTIRLTIRMINVVNSEQQPTTPANWQQLKLDLGYVCHKRSDTNEEDAIRKIHHEEDDINNSAVQQCDTVALARRQLTITLPWSFFVLLLCTIILCLYYSYFGSTISPLATARQFVVDVGSMAGAVNHNAKAINISQSSVAASLTAPDNGPTSSTAPIPMDINQEAAAGTVDNAADVTMRAESISSGSRTSSTVAGETMMNIEQLIWNNLVTQQCAQMVRSLLNDADFYPICTMSSTDKLKAFAEICNMRPIQDNEDQNWPQKQTTASGVAKPK
eukprot:5396214-Amphidinium_carterae.2